MSFAPPFQPDPNAYRLDVPPFSYPGVPKGIPTSGGIVQAQQKPAIQIHAPAVGTEMPATTYSVPSDSSDTPKTPTTDSGSQGNQTDTYLQSLQNAVKADQALVDHPYQAPQYKPPAKGLEYLAAGLSLLFPGSPISYAATGLAGGLTQRSQDQYKRDEQQEQQRVTGLERTAQIENQIADAQGAIQERRQAVDQRHADTLASLQERTREYNQSFPLKVASLQAKVNYQNGELANMAARNTITQEDAQLAASTRYQVAVMQQAGLNQRNANNGRLKTLIAQAQSSTTQTDQQLKSLDAAVAAGALDPAKAQSQAAALIAANQTKVSGLLNSASTLDPSLGSAGTLQSLGSASPQNPYGWPQPAAAQPPITINVNPNGTPNGVVLPGEQSTLPTTSAQPPVQTPPAAVFPGHPSLGHGSGIPEPNFKSALDHYTQAAGQFKTPDEVLHDIAASPGGALLSQQQVHQIVQTWEKTQAAHAQQHANPQAASTKGATAQQPSGYAADSGTTPQIPAFITNAVKTIGNHLREDYQTEQQTMGLNKPIVQPASAAEEKPQTVLDLITATAKNTKGLGEPGVPLLRALVAAESGDNPNAQSGVGAIGLGQLMPGTAKELGVNPKDPKQNLEGSARYLAQLLQQFHSIPLALAAYNAGPGAVQKYRGIPPYPETQAYVQRVLGLYRQLTARR